MGRPVDWNATGTKFGMILRDFETCNVRNAAVGLSVRGQTQVEVWVRDCTAAEKAGDWDAPVPNNTFTTGPWDIPTPPQNIIDGMPRPGTSLANRIQGVLAGEVGTQEFENWKLQQCYDAIAKHIAARG